MLGFLKRAFRKRYLRKYSSSVPTSLLPLSKLSSAVAFVDATKIDFEESKNALMAFFKANKLKGEIFFFDFRKIDDEERLITSINNTILKKDLNFAGKPSEAKLRLLTECKPDLFISLIDDCDFPIEFLANFSEAKFKVGRVQLPGQVFDLVVANPAEVEASQMDAIHNLAFILSKIA